MPDAAEKLTPRAYANKVKPSWCPGCGDFGVLAGLKKALVELEIYPHEVLIVSGIGCGSKLPDYIRANGFMTVHGRPLPVATGAKLANSKLHVMVVDGDGDGYGIGGNHFIHTCRRNPDIAHLVENNQIYALTKGQYSPTSDRGFKTTTSPEGAIEEPINPLTTALAAGAGFVARASAGEPKKMAQIIAEAVRHKGYALVDILQPCVTFNKVNTYEWYAERAYDVNEEGHDPSDYDSALRIAHEWGDKIPVGILYRREGEPVYGEQVPGLEQGPVVGRALDDLSKDTFNSLKREFL